LPKRFNCHEKYFLQLLGMVRDRMKMKWLKTNLGRLRGLKK